MGVEDITCGTQGECSTVFSVGTSTSHVWLEQNVVLFFRLWHMIFLCSGGILTVIILLCCCFKCRIPRTKQEIESDFRRRKVTRKFRRELDKMQMEEIDIKDIRSVLDKVREKFSRKPSLNKDGRLEGDENEEGLGEGSGSGSGSGSGTMTMLKTRFLNIFSKMNKKSESESERNVEPNKQSETENI